MAKRRAHSLLLRAWLGWARMARQDGLLHHVATKHAEQLERRALVAAFARWKTGAAFARRGASVIMQRNAFRRRQVR